MMRHVSLLLGPVALTAALALPGSADAQIFEQRGTAILPPAECPDVPGCLDRKQGTFAPCYSPTTPISTRWEGRKEIPYYPGYCHHFSKGTSYGSCAPDVPACGMVMDEGYGSYSGGRRDEANLNHLGGNGPYMQATADILDAIGGTHGSAASCPHGH